MQKTTKRIDGKLTTTIKVGKPVLARIAKVQDDLAEFMELLSDPDQNDYVYNAHSALATISTSMETGAALPYPDDQEPPTNAPA